MMTKYAWGLLVLLAGAIVSGSTTAAEPTDTRSAVQGQKSLPGVAKEAPRSSAAGRQAGVRGSDDEAGRSGGVRGVDDDNLAARLSEVEERLATIEQTVKIENGKVTLSVPGSRIEVSETGIEIESTGEVNIRSAARVNIVAP